MKINTEQLNALMQEQTKKSSQQQGAPGFEDLLTQEMQKSQSSASASGMGQTVPLSQPGVLGINALLQSQGVEASNGQQEIMETMTGVLDQWDSYVEKLGSSGTTLRSAYSDLQDITQKMSKLKDTSGPENMPPGLEALRNEMEVLATTETFKLNRGDYSA